MLETCWLEQPQVVPVNIFLFIQNFLNFEISYQRRDHFWFSTFVTGFELFAFISFQC